MRKNEPNKPNVWNLNQIVRISDSVRNQNCLGMELKLKMLKSERSDIGRLLYSEMPKSGKRQQVRILDNFWRL